VAKIAALVVLAVGLALLAMMVATEGEPGALPLGLVALGLVGYFVARARSKQR
jgi:MYXO-CTERM domain-containing protein